MAKNRARTLLLILLLACAGIALVSILSGGREEQVAAVDPLAGAEDPAPGTETEARDLETPSGETPPANTREVHASTPVEDTPRTSPAPIAGWRVLGEVLGPDSRPVPDARARVSLRVSGSPLGGETVVTDRDGRFEILLPPPRGISPHAHGNLGISCRVDAAGFLEEVVRENELPDLGGESADVPLRVSLERGASLRGRVLDGLYMPIAGAEIALCDGSGAVIARTPSAAGGSGEQGRFLFPIESAGDRWVVATSLSAGLVCTGPLALDPGEDVDLGDLVLTGLGTLDGVVTLPDGAPLGEMEVRAYPVEPTVEDSPSPGQGWSGPLSRVEQADLCDLPGMPWGSSVTGSNGRFSIGGLAQGSYLLVVSSGLGQGLDPQGPFETGSFATLVAPLYRMRIRVTDGDGLALPGTMVSVEGEGSMGFSAVDGPDATLEMTVSPGVWVLGANHHGAPPASETVEVVPERHDYSVELVVEVTPATGRLRIRVLGPGGEPVDGFRVDLSQASLGDPILDLFGKSLAPALYGLEPDGEGLLPPVPVGSYSIEVLPGDRFFGALFPIEHQVQILEDQEESLVLTARAGGRIRFTLLVPDGVEAPAAEEVRFALQALGANAFTALSGFTYREDGRISTARSPRLGAPQVTGLLEPGAYTLRVSAPGFEDIERGVRISPGDTTEFELRW